MRHSILFFCLLFSNWYALAQEYNYVQYNTKDGLAGSTVYDMVQGGDGFIWLATDNGLCRFDGKNFKAYTVKDGLPDNEVLKIFHDKLGRLWIGSFSEQVSYYKEGEIYNQSNDSLLSKIKLKGSVLAITESEDSCIGIFTVNGFLHVIRNDNSHVVFDFKNYFSKSSLYAFANHCIGVAAEGKKYVYSKKSNNLELEGCDNDMRFDYKGTGYLFIVDKKSFKILKKIKAVGDRLISSNWSGQGFYFQNSSNGAWVTNGAANTGWLNHFLPGEKVTRSLIDKEGNYWFSTLGKGVYKLASQEMQTFAWPQSANSTLNPEVFCIEVMNGTVYCGLINGSMLAIKANSSPVLSYFGEKAVITNTIPMDLNRLFTMNKLSGGTIIAGFDGALAKINKGPTIFRPIYPVKSIAEINSEYILVGTSKYVFKIRVSNMQIVDTVWHGRCTDIFYQNGLTYVGTMGGLYEVGENTGHTFLGVIHPTLSKRITDIKADANGTLWVASSSHGIVALRSKKVIATLSEANGLSSNNCKTLFIKNNTLWVGTGKGLNKVDIANSKAVTARRYGTSDGLPSDIINAVYANESIIWVGTPAGLTRFNEPNVSIASHCDLSLSGIFIDGAKAGNNKHHQLGYKKNTIAFSYVAVSVRSAGEITYYYRLNGFTSSWQTTAENSISYPALPPGRYAWEIYAVNKFGVKSKTITVKFDVAAPFWKTGWFYLLAASAVVGLVAWFFSIRNAASRKKLEEKNKTARQFAQLEQQALQAQMNPHFIFNCLNSIQQFIISGDKENANRYLTGFATLVRTTLEYSGKKSIAVEEEAAYLEQYLTMETLRYGGVFTYEINVTDSLKNSPAAMPALLVQPFVENSIRHGLRYKKRGTGKVQVDFSIQGDLLVCTVSDNGVGRKKSEEYKTGRHIEYQSRGTELAQKRIALFNKVHNTNIALSINDNYDAAGNATGTVVFLTVPLQNTQYD